jgi:hypothetical protein
MLLKSIYNKILAVILLPVDVIFAQLANPLNDMILLFTSGITNPSLYKHWFLVQSTTLVDRTKHGLRVAVCLPCTSCKCTITKLPNLRLKTLAKQLLGYPPLSFALPFVLMSRGEPSNHPELFILDVCLSLRSSEEIA